MKEMRQVKVPDKIDKIRFTAVNFVKKLLQMLTFITGNVII